jgi:hypothetical protein
MTLPNAPITSVTKFKDDEMVEMMDKEFKNLVLKMINVSNWIQTNR